MWVSAQGTRLNHHIHVCGRLIILSHFVLLLFAIINYIWKSQLQSQLTSKVTTSKFFSSGAYCNILFVNRTREMVSFELSKEIEKDVFCLVMSIGQRKNFESLWGIKPQTFGFCTPMLYQWATETLQWARSIMKLIWCASLILLGLAMLIASCL